ncbi:MAG: type II toxin-antitoxin system RelE/ParE family toxin [Thermoanaerobaculia bacterium]
MKLVHLEETAKSDLREEAEWYRVRDPEVARRFLDEVFRALALVEQFPLIGARPFGVKDPNVRQLPVSNFPYQIVFKRLEDRTFVIAIAHERRKPGYWNR